MADDKIIESHNVNTLKHEMNTQGCHLKEIKKIHFDEDNFDKKTVIVHIRTIKGKMPGVPFHRITSQYS